MEEEGSTLVTPDDIELHDQVIDLAFHPSMDLVAAVSLSLSPPSPPPTLIIVPNYDHIRLALREISKSFNTALRPTPRLLIISITRSPAALFSSQRMGNVRRLLFILS